MTSIEWAYFEHAMEQLYPRAVEANRYSVAPKEILAICEEYARPYASRMLHLNAESNAKLIAERKAAPRPPPTSVPGSGT